MVFINYMIIMGELLLLSFDKSFAIFWRILELNQIMSLALFINSPLLRNSFMTLRNLYLYNISPLVPNVGLQAYNYEVKTEGYDAQKFVYYQNQNADAMFLINGISANFVINFLQMLCAYCIGIILSLFFAFLKK